jgi:hypothetical protein
MHDQRIARHPPGAAAMTGYTVHTGSTTKFSTSWDRIFAGKSAGGKSRKVTSAGQRPAKKAAGKARGKRRGG